MKNLPFDNMVDMDASRNMTTQFLGYNHTLRPGQGQWYDMKNLTSSFYPVLSPRRPRGLRMNIEHLQGIAGKDKLAYVADNQLYFGDQMICDLAAERYEILVSKPVDWDDDCTKYFADTNGTRATQGTEFVTRQYYQNQYFGVQRTIVSMGAYLVVFPDKIYVNSVKPTDYGDLEAEFNNAPQFSGELPRHVTLTPCDAEGNEYEEMAYRITSSMPSDWGDNYMNYYVYESGTYYLNNGSSPTQYQSVVWRPHVFYEKWNRIGTEKPEEPADGDIWIDTGDPDKPVTRKYSATMQMWVEVSAVYFKIACDGIGDPFREEDTVSVTGMPDASMDVDYNIVKVDANYLVVAGAISGATDGKEDFRVKRLCPDMDFVIEGENRLWGCRYGVSSKTGEFVNEIYACKLGDFRNWYTYAGISTDAYAVSLGSDGSFTGAVFYAGYPTFFKERYIHRIAGNYPANYCLYTTVCDGVQAGSGKSLAVVNGNLIYKSPTGVMTYTGSYPQSISSVFADEMYYDAVAGEVGSKYYISMRNEKEQYRLFVFDAEKGLWHIEDETHAHGFARVSDRLYCMCDDSIFAVSGHTTDERIEWYAQTGILGAEYPDRSYVSRINIRACLQPQAQLEVCIEYDSNGKWEKVFVMTGADFTSEAISIIPRRCDHYALRLSGVGECKIYSITNTVEQGSDNRW